jgi:hypothetical protein
MGTAAKVTAYAIGASFWLASLIAKHYYPDIDISAFTTAISAALGGMGAIHAQNSRGRL